MVSFLPESKWADKYIKSNIDNFVKHCYTINNEKVPGGHIVSRNVFWRFWQLYDVESTKGRNRRTDYG